MSNAYAPEAFDAFDEFDLDTDFADPAAPSHAFPAAGLGVDDGDINPREPLQFTALGAGSASAAGWRSCPPCSPR